jgi:hypothetical protein
MLQMFLYQCCKSRSGMLHMLQWLYTYISSVCSKCFICFRRMLCRFYKSGSGCCIYLQSVCFKCFRCFIRMLQVFYLDIVYVCNGYARVFWYFRRMLQVFHLFRTYVASVSPYGRLRPADASAPRILRRDR